MNRLDSLSPCENKVLLLLAGGHSNRSIAKCLGKSVKTTDNQRTSIYRKLHVRNATQAVAAFWKVRLT